jgi:hypothetical protein
MNDGRMSIGQTIGILLFVFTSGIPGMHLAGFWSGTSLPLPVWLLVAFVGGFVGGLLLASEHRIAGAVGGMIAGPLGLLAIYFYAHGRQSIHTVELVLVQGVASLPGVGVYFVLRLLTDALFPAWDDDDKEDGVRRKRRRDRDDDDEEEPRPKRRRRTVEVDEDEEEPRPKRRRSRAEDE